LVWDPSDSSNPKIWEVGEEVKGYWNGGSVKSGEIFLHNNAWYKANQDTSDTPGSTSSWSSVDPLLTASTDKTSEYMNLSNADLWTKTHYGNLVGDTIDQDYVRGDTFLHEGKHYIYVSAKGSSDYEYDPDQDGITEFEQLKDSGAIMELPMYVDTIGRGGSSDLADGVYYRPNQELEFVDRMADSGLVRTNSISRRGEPGISDEIFNSRDDLYYGGLNPGNDGIYGTSDDTYTTTRYPHLAQAGGHVDSDADNNKDLLDTSNDLTDFSVPDFVDFIQTIANFRAMNGGTMSRLDYTTRMLDENITNLGAAYGRIMDADIAMESSNFARQNVMVQASASMVAQANQLTNVALTLLGR
jgi:flagellin-like hook-associated protein FlgL